MKTTISIILFSIIGPLAMIMCFLSWYIPKKTSIKNRGLCYLAGKISGLPRWYVVLKFWIFEMWLRVQGYDVINPTWIPEQTSYNDAMDICISNLKRAEFVYFMFDWTYSPGARIEFNTACRADKKLVNTSVELNELFNSVKRILN